MKNDKENIKGVDIMNGNFNWIKISERIANKILEYKDNDEELMDIIQNIKTDDIMNLRV